jgi:predicted dehydrogenase
MPTHASDDEPSILIGYGSIGRQHAQVLSTRPTPLLVVDRDPAAIERVHAAHPDALVVADLDAAAGLGWSFDRSLAVVATWGPSHRALFDDLADRGVRKVLCEKPLASSVSDGVAMLDRARREEIDLGVNYTRRYMGHADGLLELARQNRLGEPTGVVVHGGARGLVTNGIHLLELVCDLFGENPASVVSTAQGQALNPRSPDLMLYGGMACWTFASGRECVVNLSLGSRLKEWMVVYFRDGRIDVADASSCRVWSSNDAESSQDLGPTAQTRAATRLGYEGPIPGAVDPATAIGRVLDALASADHGVLRPQDHLRSLDGCIGALLAGERRESVSLPLQPGSPEADRRWPIS